jgi:hypothetical protein
MLVVFYFFVFYRMNCHIDQKVDVEQHISERAYKLNILKFWIKVWYQSHLYVSS